MPWQLSIDRLRTHAAEQFGIESISVKAFAGEHDRNLRLTDPDGVHHLVKLSGPTSSTESLDWQERILVELEGTELPFQVPRLAVARNGTRRVEIGTQEPLHMRVLSWVEGTLLSEVSEHPGGLRRSLGGASALLTEALANIVPDSPQPRHHWLVEDADDSLESVLSALPAGPERELVERVREFHAMRAGDLRQLPQGTVHQDLHDQNVLVAPGAHDRVAGVIDFNDACYTARIADLGIACAYGMVRQREPVDALVEIVEGYLERAPLTDAEISAVFPIAVMRLAVNWTTWRARAAAGDSADYAGERSRHTLPLLRELDVNGLDRTADALRTRFERRGVSM